MKWIDRGSGGIDAACPEQGELSFNVFQVLVRAVNAISSAYVSIFVVLDKQVCISET